MNDLLSLALLSGFFIYVIYYLIRTYTFQRLAKHIRDEEKYYRDWEQ